LVWWSVQMRNVKFLIKHGTFCNLGIEDAGSLDVLINGSKIKQIGRKIPASEDMFVFDAEGKIILPGLVDVHVHFREPGQTHKESIHSGSCAAAAGGFTSVVAEPNTIPPIDTAERVSDVLRIARENSIIHFYTKACISKNMKGKELADIQGLKKAGAVAISDDGHPVPGSVLMTKALVQGQLLDLLVSPHCEESEFYRRNIMLQNSTLFRSNEMPHSSGGEEPYCSETGFIRRDIDLAQRTRARIHISHVSLAASVEAIREAKKAGVKITAEATPHHLVLNKDDFRRIGANAKVNPPLRSADDVAAVRQGLIDGTIDIIATDHAPHSPSEKVLPIEDAPFGVIGLETALGVILTQFVKTGVLDMSRIADIMSRKPAEIYGLPMPRIAQGDSPNLTIVDPKLRWKVDTDHFYSKGRNCPFQGMDLEGKAVMTIVDGRIVMKEGKIIKNDDDLLPR